jgi:hypothetical protein
MFAQPAPDVFQIDIENAVRYFADVVDPARIATMPGPVAASPTRAFTDTIFVGDIVAINGRPARGLWTSRQYAMGFNPNPQAGFAVSDVAQGTIAECKYEFMNADGVVIGRLNDTGLFPHSITGGSGSYVGAGGEQLTGTHPAPIPVRTASMQEDPGSRRRLGGGRMRIVLHVYPQFRPEIEASALGPMILHANDFTPVTAANPARRGEVLVVRARNLGPTAPAPAPGEPFPASTLSIVRAPVEMVVNGEPAEAINQVGWPGLVNAYRVDFRVPDTTVPGTAQIRLRAAWLTGDAVAIPVQ